ncbi:hypothetical protein HYS84_02315 [Candidatus Saccharibacteria bacterium]|nr:hypothetical protein [Candidatus Saccharibacteria bacterium]
MEERQYSAVCPRGHLTTIGRRTALTLFGELRLAEMDSGHRLALTINPIDCEACPENEDAFEPALSVSQERVPHFWLTDEFQWPLGH